MAGRRCGAAVLRCHLGVRVRGQLSVTICPHRTPAVETLILKIIVIIIIITMAKIYIALFKIRNEVEIHFHHNLTLVVVNYTRSHSHRQNDGSRAANLHI